jgi:hypothetical protein
LLGPLHFGFEKKKKEKKKTVLRLVFSDRYL